MEKDPKLETSPLSQDLERDGIVVNVEIYRLVGDSGWMLEVVDEFHNSTVWDEPFESEQLALGEVERVVATEGIKSLVGKPGKN